MSNNVHTGGCACGKVRFEARGEPYRVGVCHCLTCRKLHGGPFSFYAVFPVDAVVVVGCFRELRARPETCLPGLRFASVLPL